MATNETPNKAQEFKAKNGIPDAVKIPDNVWNYNYTKEQLDWLRASLAKATKLEDKQRVADDFFAKREWIVTETKDEATMLRDTLIEVNLENLKTSLDIISKEQNPETRWMLTHTMLCALERKWIIVRIDWKKVVLEGGSQDNSKLDYEITLNNFITSNKFNLENLKTAILFRTTKIDAYISMNTDSNKNVLIDKMDAKGYYEYLLKKYEIGFLEKSEIISSSKIDPRDKAFMLSYKEDAFDDYPVSTNMKQYIDDRKKQVANAPKVESEMTRRIEAMPEWPEKEKAKAAIKKDKRDINERIWDFMKDPFAEIMKISSAAGPFWWLAILWAIWYFMFTEPKAVFGWIAVWGLLKWTWIADSLWNSFWEYTREWPEAKDWKKQDEGKKQDSKWAEKKTEAKTENLSETQKRATARVTDDRAFVSLVETFSSENKNWKVWKVSHYLDFINSKTIQDKPVKALFPSKDNVNNIFLNETWLDSSIVLPSNLDPVIFKKVLRMYFVGNYKLDPNEPIPWIKEYNEFKAKYLDSTSTPAKKKDSKWAKKWTSSEMTVKKLVDKIYS